MSLNTKDVQVFSDILVGEFAIKDVLYNQKNRKRSNEEEVWNCRSGSDRLCLRILSANSGIIQEIWRQQWPKVQTFLVVTNDT